MKRVPALEFVASSDRFRLFLSRFRQILSYPKSVDYVYRFYPAPGGTFFILRGTSTVTELSELLLADDGLKQAVTDYAALIKITSLFLTFGHKGIINSEVDHRKGILIL